MRTRVASVLLWGCLAAATAEAQGNCQSAPAHVSVGAQGGVTGMDERLESGLVPHGIDEDVLVRGGPTAAFDVGVQVSPTWAIRMDRVAGLRTVRRQMVDNRGAGPSHGEGHVTQHALLAGVAHHSAARSTVCAYSHVAVGWYQFSYGRISSARPGVAAGIGIGGATGRFAPFGEVRLDVVFNHDAAPIAAYDALQLGAGAGVRYRW